MQCFASNTNYQLLSSSGKMQMPQVLDGMGKYSGSLISAIDVLSRLESIYIMGYMVVLWPSETQKGFLAEFSLIELAKPTMVVF
jgi:hypothetical protein